MTWRCPSCGTDRPEGAPKCLRCFFGNGGRRLGGPGGKLIPNGTIVLAPPKP